MDEEFDDPPTAITALELLQAIYRDSSLAAFRAHARRPRRDPVRTAAPLDGRASRTELRLCTRRNPQAPCRLPCDYNLGVLETGWRRQRFGPDWLGRARRYVAPWRRV
jgi:hypothetical protein